MAEREAGGGETTARAQLEQLDSLLSRMQALRSKYAAALAVAGETPAVNEVSQAHAPDWKQRYVRAMEAVHAPGGKRPSPVRNRTDPIVPGSPGFRRDAD